MTRVLALACITAVVSSPALAQARPESIRGRVSTDSGAAIAGAEVIATMAPNREVFRATSDSSGRYLITVSNGTGDYLVYISSVGRAPFRKRITRTGSDSVFTVDAVLKRAIETLAAVRTVARRTPPQRADDAPGLVGGLQSQFGGVAGALSPDQMGDLTAMAATTPGFALTPSGGVSVFGLDPSQNRQTLNGLTFDAGSLPRDLPVRTRVLASTYDPSLGGFAGGLIAVDVSPGQVFTTERGHVTLDAPQLQAADATAHRLGQDYTNVVGSVARAGELIQDSWVYSAAVQGSRRSSVAPSLGTADPDALNRLGVAQDSATRFLQLLGVAGIPTQLGGVSTNYASSTVSTAFRIDRAKANQLGGLATDTRARIGFIGVGALTQNGPLGASALAPSSHDGSGSSGNGMLQANYSKYFGADAEVLDEAKTALSYNAQQSNPYLDLPSGYVRLTSALPNGTGAVSGLQFGGAASTVNNRSWRWETENEVSFSPENAPSHHIKFMTQAELDGYSQRAVSNGLGTFTYNSLADLQANIPASFTRTLFSPSRDGGEVSGAFSIGDYWVKSPEFQLVFGPRVEWSAFTKAPAENPEVTRLFGARTDEAPAALHISPRIGFSWLYPGVRKAGRAAGGMGSSGLGSIYIPPKGVLRGGIGEFRSPLAPTLLSNALASTGLPGAATQRLGCVGPAVPTPNWPAYLAGSGAIPTSCIDTTGAAPFDDAAPNVQLLDPSYGAVRRWTSNLTWASAYRVLYYTLDASYTIALDQPGTYDLNFAGTPAFTLSNEGNRPVFVPASSIVSSTGVLSPLASRNSAEFGRVVSQRSDARSEIKQATLTLQPYQGQRLAWLILGGSYTFTDTRSRARGFDGATFGDPRLLEWSSGFAPRHQLRGQIGYFRGGKVNLAVTTYWGLQSGFPYTPTVAGDINGDGLSNDRAFVFTPASAPTPQVASEMTALLATTSSEARDCLLNQMGTAAARNSCRAPWSMTNNVRIDWRHQFGDFWHGGTVSLNFANPLAGVDHLVHGADNLHGWGLPVFPDPTLYFVRGFDQAAQRFIYDVNPRFGNTRPTVSALYNPFRVTLDVSFSLTPNMQRQQVDYYTRPTHNAPGVRPPADTVRARINSQGVSPMSPYGWILANSDSLLLSAQQTNALLAGQAHYAARIDSTWQSLATDLASLPPNFDPAAAMKRIQQTNMLFQQSSLAPEGVLIRGILTPIQMQLLPAQIRSMITGTGR